MRILFFCWLIALNLMAAGLARPEFSLPPGTHVRPMGALFGAFFLALLAMAGVRHAAQQFVPGRRALAVAGAIAVLLCLSPLPVYLGLSSLAEHSRGLVVEK